MAVDRVGRRLGLGGMTELVLARRIGSLEDELVTIQRLLPHVLSEPSVADAFVLGAERASEVLHPNLVEILEVHHEPGEVAVVSEYVSGEPVTRLLARAEAGRALPASLAVFIVEKVASALDEAHRRDLLHLDLRPSHVVVTYDGAVKLLELGISRADPDHRFAKPGTVRHRLAYAAPEALRKEPVDARADVFSLGVLLWELLAGRRLFFAPSPAETAQLVLERAVEPPSVFNSAIPPELDALTLRALARSPDRRLESAAQFAEEARSAVLEVPAREVGRFMRSKLAHAWASRRELELEVLAQAEGVIAPSSIWPSSVSLVRASLAVSAVRSGGVDGGMGARARAEGAPWEKSEGSGGNENPGGPASAFTEARPPSASSSKGSASLEAPLAPGLADRASNPSDTDLEEMSSSEPGLDLGQATRIRWLWAALVLLLGISLLAAGRLLSR